jgi:hypothetical protein
MEHAMLPSPEDHVAINDLIARYCMTLSVGDIEGWVGLFTPEGSFKVYGRSWEGHARLRDMVTNGNPGLHLGGPPVIEMVDRDNARSQRNLFVINSKTGIQRSAVYDDDLVRTAAGWRFAAVRCRFIVAGGLSDRPEDKPAR